MKQVSLPGLVFLGLVIFFAAVGQLGHPFNHDNAVHLHTARVILEHGSLYTNFYETNPPLFSWATLVPVWLSSQLGVPEIGLFRLCIFIFALFVLLNAMDTLRRGMEDMGHELSRRREIALFGLWGFGFLCLQGYDFGQREHVIALALLPYVLFLGLRLSSEEVTGKAWGPHVFLAFAIALKPFYLPVWLVGEALVTVRHGDAKRLLSLGNLLVVGLGSLYLLAVWAFEPAYYEMILPLLLATYGDIRNSVSSSEALLWLSFTGLGLLMITIFWMRLRSNKGGQKDADARARTEIKYWLTIASLVTAQIAWLAFLMQARFEYQLWPFLLFSCLPASFIFVSPRQSERSDQWYTIGAPIMAVGVLTIVLAQPQRFMEGLSLGQAAWEESNEDLKQMVRLLDTFAEGEEFYIFSTNVSSAFPAAQYSKANWKFRYHTLWPLPAIDRMERACGEGGTASGVELKAIALRQTVAHDFNRFRPTLVLVDVSEFKSFFSDGGKFDYLAFFKRSRSFRRAFETYVPCGSLSLGDARKFDVFIDMTASTYNAEECDRRFLTGVLAD